MLRQGLQTFADKQVSMRFEVPYAGLQGEPTNQMVNTLGDYLHMNKVKQISPLDETWHGVSASACVRNVVQKESQARLRLYGKDIHSLSLETPGLKHTSSDLQKRRVVHEVSKACAKKVLLNFGERISEYQQHLKMPRRRERRRIATFDSLLQRWKNVILTERGRGKWLSGKSEHLSVYVIISVGP